MKQKHIIFIILAVFAILLDFIVTTQAYLHDPVEFSKYEANPVISILADNGIIPTFIILISFGLIYLSYYWLYKSKDQKTGKKCFTIVLLVMFSAHFTGGISWIIGGWF